MSGFRELSTHINCFTTISLSEKHWVFLSKFNMKTQILVRTFETPHSLTLTSFFNFSIYYIHHWRRSMMKSSSSSNFAYMFTLCLKKLSSLILSVSDYVNATVFLFVSVSVSLSLFLSLSPLAGDVLCRFLYLWLFPCCMVNLWISGISVFLNIL